MGRILQAFGFCLVLFSGIASAQENPLPENLSAVDAPKFILLLNSEDGQVKSQARYALVSLGREAVPALINALENKQNLNEIIYILNCIKDERAAGPMARLLGIEDQETNEKLKSALFSLGRASLPHLFDALKDARRRKAASEVLYSMKDPEYFKKIRKLLKDKDPFVRRYAAAVEEGWLDPEAAAEMAGLLKDEDAETRREASAYFLGLSPDVETPGLPSLLKDSDVGVRINALKITIKRRDDRFFGEVCGITATDPDNEARELAAEALFRCYRDKALQPLLLALKDGDDSVGVAAAGWLAEMKAKEAAPDILAFLKKRASPSDMVVESAARALGEIGGDYDPNVLLPYINWENLYVVRSVLKAWELSARPSDSGIKDALAKYLEMQVDVRYKDRAKTLLQKLSQTK